MTTPPDNALPPVQVGEHVGPYFDVVFAPVEASPDLTFVEVEDPDGRSIRVGEWVNDGRYQRLRIPRITKANEEVLRDLMRFQPVGTYMRNRIEAVLRGE